MTPNDVVQEPSAKHRPENSSGFAQKLFVLSSKNTIHSRGCFYHRLLFICLNLPDEMEVSGKCLPLVDPLSPSISCDNDALSELHLTM